MYKVGDIVVPLNKTVGDYSDNFQQWRNNCKTNPTIFFRENGYLIVNEIKPRYYRERSVLVCGTPKGSGDYFLEEDLILFPTKQEKVDV